VAESTNSSTAEVPSDSSYIADRTGWPDPPQIPEDFTWTGRYQVPDLGIEVPFTWHGQDGDFQMVAGGEDYPIHFTNLIYEGELYILTYEWPGIPRQYHMSCLTPLRILNTSSGGFLVHSLVGLDLRRMVRCVVAGQQSRWR
ncbi:MAG: hypothetical protein ACTHW3_10970, partial [Leucobacter sp.]